MGQMFDNKLPIFNELSSLVCVCARAGGRSSGVAFIEVESFFKLFFGVKNMFACVVYGFLRINC